MRKRRRYRLDQFDLETRLAEVLVGEIVGDE